jgi:hypothetical protein
MSLVVADGEWRTRKINLFAVIKGFVSQIKVGADRSYFISVFVLFFDV